MKIKVYLLSAFGVSKNGGNPAGVVLNADSLTDNQKKAISKIVNYSETAFISSSDKADFKVTFFTPKDEVDLCGHATIATYSLLYQKHLFK
ncbi:PhzF family phenazine biosynthesis protein, partial [Candidatus Roizmanbacteria bacterium CG_4_10_14_0_8_um_filter_36_36]